MWMAEFRSGKRPRYLVISLLLTFFATLHAQHIRIANQAVAVYDFSGVQYSTPSNVVETIVLPIYSFEIFPNGDTLNPARRVLTQPGATVYIGYILINTGNASDSFRLLPTYIVGSFPLGNPRIYRDLNRNGRLDPGEDVPINRVDNVGPDSIVHLLLAFDIPSTAPLGDSVFVNITGISMTNNAVDDNNWSLIKVVSGPIINACKTVNTPVTHPGDTLRYEIRFMNVGQQDADSVVVIDYINYDGYTPYTIFVPHSDGTVPHSIIKYLWRNDLTWRDSLPPEAEDVAGIKAIFYNISVMQSAILWFSVEVDSSVPESIQIENVALIVSYGAQGRVSDTTITNVAISIPVIAPTLHVGPYGNPQALPGGEGSDDDVQHQDSVETGIWVTFRNTVLNEGPVPATVEFSIDTSELGLGPNSIVFLTDASLQTRLFDSNGDGYPDIGPLRPGEERHIGVRIWVPDSLPVSKDSIVGRLVITVHPHGFDTLTNSTVDEFVVRPVTPTYSVNLTKFVEPDTVVVNGTRLMFRIRFENTGNSTLQAFNIYDGLSECFDDPQVPEHLVVEDLNHAHEPILAQGTYDSSSRFVHFYMDSIPIGFAGEVKFFATATIPDSANEVVAYNVASTIASGMQRPDTSNRVTVHIIRPVLEINKRSKNSRAEIGDIVHYEITVSNKASYGTLYNLTIYDTMPNGFRVIENGFHLPDGVRVLKNRNNIIEFGLDSLPCSTSVVIGVDAAIGPGARVGHAENRAWAVGHLPSSGTRITDGPAVASVEVSEGFATSRGFIFGKVFIDENDNSIQDEGEPGVAGVIVRMDNGLYAVTDSAGRYSISGVLPGPHGVWLDMASIPDGLVPVPVSIASMGDGRSQLINLPRSLHYKANFRLIRIAKRITRFESEASLVKSAHVVSDSTLINITLPSTYFRTGKATLMPDAPIEQFKNIAELVKSIPGWKVIVEGHTDPRPIHTKEFPDNYALSIARAKAVAKLLESFGVPESIIEIHGYGPDRPKVPNTSPANMAVNRRTEVRLVPKDNVARGLVEYRIRFVSGTQPLDSLLISDVIPEGMQVDTVLVSRVPDGAAVDVKLKGNRLEVEVDKVQPRDTVEVLYRVRVTDVVSAARYYNNARARFYINSVLQGDLLNASVELDTSEIRTPVSYTIKFPSEILFATGKADLRPQSIPYLNHILKILNAYPAAHARLEGHTDPRPIHTKEFPSNMELAKARAMAVYRWLVAQGVDSSRLEVAWFADRHPLVPNTNMRNMAINRRTEVTIYFPPENVRTESKSDSSNIEFVTLRFKVSDQIGAKHKLKIGDVLPLNAKYVQGSATANGVKIDDPELVVDSSDSAIRLTFMVPFDVVKNSDTLTLVYAVARKGGVEATRHIEAIDTLTVDDVPAILYPKDGQVITDRNAIDIDIAVHYMVPFQLIVNGEVVPMDRCGVTKTVQSRFVEERKFIGIRLRGGENLIVLKGVDASGKLVERKVRVYVSGEPAILKLQVLNEPVPADGITRPRVLVELFDADSLPVGSNIVLDLEFEGVKPWSEDQRPVVPGYQVVLKEGRAVVELAPASNPHKGTVVARYSDEVADTLSVEYLPDIKPLEVFAFGNLEGTYNTGESELTHRSILYLWAYGRVWRDVVMKASARYDPLLDSLSGNSGLPLMGITSPLNDLYPTYGDASRVVNFATSRTGVFLRLEKGLSYIQYGDFAGFKGGADLNFSRYRRALTGISFHLDGKLVEVDGVAAPDGQVVKHDEFAADGTYGPFMLSNAPIIENSDEVYVITRDRLHPEIILKRVKLERNEDYELDPVTGRLDLKMPIPSFDEDFNPNYIFVMYEVIGNGGELAYGGKITLHPFKNSSIGLTLGHSSPNRNNSFDVKGAFFDLNLSKLRGRVEGARSYMNGIYQGDAYSVSLSADPFDWLKLNGKYAFRSDGFSNSSSLQPLNSFGGEDGALSADLRLSRWMGVRSHVSVRKSSDGKRSLSTEELLSVRFSSTEFNMGYKHVVERSPLPMNGYLNNTASSDMLVLGLNSSIMHKIKLSLRHEQALSSEGNLTIDPPRSVAQLNFNLLNNLGITMSTEHRWNSEGRTVGLIGLNTSPWKNAKAFTKYSIQGVGSSERNQAIVGLSQTVPLTSKLSLQGNIEYVHYLSGISPGRLSLALGGQLNDTDKKASLRFSDVLQGGNHNLGVIVSSVVRLADGTAIVFNEKLNHSSGKTMSEGLFGFAYRPKFTDRVNAFAAVRHFYSDRPNSGITNRVIGLCDISFQPSDVIVLDARYGVKRLLDTPVTSHLLSMWIRLQLPKDKRFYTALGFRSLYQPSTSSIEHDLSAEVGWIVMKNMVVGAGYNFYGLGDTGFAWEETKKGIYLRFGTKFGTKLEP